MEAPVSVIILAAGLGTRMKSRKAKVLHRAGGMPLVEHVVRLAATVTAPDRVIAIIGHQAEEVQSAVRHYGVRFAAQAEQRGTADAVATARDALSGEDGLVVVLVGDSPLLGEETLRELIERQQRSSAAATLITTRVDDPTGYGRVLTDDDGRITAIVEQKAATPEQLEICEINTGVYCFQAPLLWKHLAEIGTGNPAGEYYLTDIVEILRRAGHSVDTFPVEDYTEMLGINTRIELAEADRILRDRKVCELMLAGVTIERPETVTIDAGVRVGLDTVIGPFAQILGDTEIGEDCAVGAAAIVSNSKLGNRVEIGPFTIVNSSEVGDEARVGPFARLRMDNRLEAGAAVGNFVELKKTSMGPGAKANHLAYIGDAAIDANVNVGAGTITCNYDGVAKHPTTIGEGAFIGSNSTLVAPLEIGPGSYIAAGSVVTEPVPPDALALGRSRQTNKEGWAARRREVGRKKP